MSDIEEMVKRLRAGTNGWNSNPAMKAAADVLEAQAKRIAELEASLADSNEALQVMGLKLAHAEGHSANTVGGPTPVMDAAPACERKDNYRIVEGPSLESLEQRVNFLLRAGWTCVGSVTFSTIPYTGISVDRRPTEKYMQAMVYCSNEDTRTAGESDS